MSEEPRFPVVIHHNPDCGTSRNVLAVIEAAGYRPEIVDYLTSGWTRPQLLALFAAAHITPRDAMREKDAAKLAPDLLSDEADDADILAAMIKHPVLVQRPLVATPKGVALCRPSEVVLDLLDRWPKGPFRKEDGELMIDKENRRASEV